MISPTYGNLTITQVAEKIKQYIKKNPTRQYNLYVGTDSQNFSVTKIVTVIAVCDVGHGGIFFYDVSRINRISNIRLKLFKETELSLECTDRLFNAFTEIGYDYTEDNVSFSIHVDAGKNGPSGEVIPEIVGWIKAMGYNVSVKPESIAASSIADKISK